MESQPPTTGHETAQRVGFVRVEVSRLSSEEQSQATRQALAESAASLSFVLAIEEQSSPADERILIVAHIPAAHTEAVGQSIIAALRETPGAGKGCRVAVWPMDR